MTQKSPKLLYDRDVDQKHISLDPEQVEIVNKIQRVYESIVAQDGLFKTIFKVVYHKFITSKVKGLYLWGDVGVGKTYLMDLLYKSVSNESIKRAHFHVFMKEVHSKLQDIQGQKDPLRIYVKELANKIKIFCFDEFLVTDIADALILERLLKAFQDFRILLVITSNVHPSNLYLNGLQRSRFLPAIDLIYQIMDVVELKGKRDYRLRFVIEEGVYFSPLCELTDNKMFNTFKRLTGFSQIQTKFITILQRKIKTRAISGGVIWINFQEICFPPRAKFDYLEIAKIFNTVLLSNVPRLDRLSVDVITNFVHLVDIFYDYKVKLIISAEIPLNELMETRINIDSFKRTISRLREMSTEYYLHQAHSINLMAPSNNMDAN